MAKEFPALSPTAIINYNKIKLFRNLVLVEKENWDISSGNCGHQCVLHPRGLSAESVEPRKVGTHLVTRSGFPSPGSCAALRPAGLRKTIPEHKDQTSSAPQRSSSQEELGVPCLRRATSLRAPGQGQERHGLCLQSTLWPLQWGALGKG